MNKARFLERRQPSWRRFEDLLNRRRSLRWSRLTPAETAEFSRLLRELANDLATMRSRDWGQSLIDYLNHLVLQGHDSFYRASPAGFAALVEFLVAGFPRVFRRNAGYFGASAALFFVPFAASWVAVQHDPTLALRVIAAEQLDHFDEMYSDSASRDDESAKPDGSADDNPPPSDSEDATPPVIAPPDAMPADPQDAESTGPGDSMPADETDDDDSSTDSFGHDEIDGDYGNQRALMAGFYIQHNIGIALQCFARGLLLGVGTMYTLLYNGIALGTVFGYVLSLGHTERFLSFVVSHGSFELTAIAVSGGAGLMLGDAFVHPGQRTRLEALWSRGNEAVQIAGGAAAMLFIAALIEAFWSPAPIPPAMKYMVGGALWTLVAAYLTFSGWRR